MQYLKQLLSPQICWASFFTQSTFMVKIIYLLSKYLLYIYYVPSIDYRQKKKSKIFKFIT